jgi:alkanesulfonate monooxygenase SsuD/methylene tetrahydromethanopterin reductase-like flavin-dependent oxidoreductase (luciferase family)
VLVAARERFASTCVGNAPAMEIGYSLSSEEHAPLDLVRDACRAEEVGFTFALISDHFRRGNRAESFSRPQERASTDPWRPSGMSHEQQDA